MDKGPAAASPDAYVAGLNGWRRERVEALRAAVRAVAGLTETVKWGHLVYLSNGPALLIRAEGRRVLLGFWRGQRLRGLEPRLKPGGQYEMATISLAEGDTIEPSVVTTLTRAAFDLNATLGDPTKAPKKENPMKRSSNIRFAALAATSLLALAAARSPALAQTPTAPAATATVQTAPRADSATVEGGEVRYFVHGDLASGKTPVLVLHGAFMSSDSMKPLTDLITDRPLIVVDQRGHARTGDLPGPITYENLADDAAAVLADAGVAKADVVGYSMGAGAALQLALRHPGRVDHLVIASVSFNEAGNLPGFTQMMAGITPEIFAGTPMEAEFKRLAPNPEAFASVVNKIKVMDQGQDWPAEQIRALTSPTFIIIGDHDIVRPEHAVELYRLRGGGDTARASQPFLTEAPPARLAILPGASHIDVFGDPALLAAMILPFLDDRTRPRPPGLFEDVPGE